jgi:PAS domain S-box-containing protein
MATSQRNGSDASLPSRNPAQTPAGSGGYDALLDLLPLGVYRIDRDSRILSINPVAAELVGREPSEVLGRPCREVLQCAFCAEECAATAAREHGVVRTGFPVEIGRGDGARRSVLIDAVPLEEGAVAVLLRDVTESERLRKAMHERWVFHGLVCVSPAMKEVVAKVRDVAPYDSTVLILGESGTGKELVARGLHAESPRAPKPFVVVNCAAYSETLLESELFGHVRGSFTGADRDRRGRFELAHGGTVLLDEIGEIPPKIQVKLLRVLQEREIERVGESRTRPVDIRILASTNRDLWKEVREGRFREDLFYRLNVFTVELPPLRERRDDVPALADHLLQRLSERTGKVVRGVSEAVLATLVAHDWPGNVRELENVLESAVVRARGAVITEIDLHHRGSVPGAASDEDRMDEALRRTAGCVTRAARLLGVHRTTLWRHMREKGVERGDYLQG